MDKDDAGFFGYDKADKRRNTWCIPSFDGYDKADKRRNTWCIPSFDNEVRAEKDKSDCSDYF